MQCKVTRQHQHGVYILNGWSRTYSGDLLLMKVEGTMLHLRHNGILMTAEIPMSPKSTDDWVETLQTRSIPLMVSNALRLDIYGPCEFCCISMLMKKQRKGHSRHSERLRSKVTSDQVPVYHHNTLPERHACTLFVHTAPPQKSTEQPTEKAPTRWRPLRRPKSKCSQAAE
jgi:hypothetical protein